MSHRLRKEPSGIVSIPAQGPWSSQPWPAGWGDRGRSCMCEELNFGGLCGEYCRGVKLELELVNGGRVLELGLATAQHASGEGERAGSG